MRKQQKRYYLVYKVVAVDAIADADADVDPVKP